MGERLGWVFLWKSLSFTSEPWPGREHALDQRTLLALGAGRFRRALGTEEPKRRLQPRHGLTELGPNVNERRHWREEALRRLVPETEAAGDH